MKRQTPYLVLAGGGSGGHVIPAIAIAKETVRRGGRARFVGTSNRIEARLVPEAGFGIDYIRVRPLTGGGPLTSIRGLAAVPFAVARSAHLLRRLAPDVVMGVGGYVAGPVVLAARMLGIPTALLEQNATIGLTNKLLVHAIKKAFVSYEETLKLFPTGRAIFTGNPVGQTILDAAKAKNEKIAQDMDAKGPLRIVVMGGSQGASAIDERVPAAVKMAKLDRQISVLHQCAADHENQVAAAYKSGQINAEVVPFINDTASAYLKADLVIARSGATTIAELNVMGLPAVLLPYPHHSDRQQHRNAEPMRSVNAAHVLDEQETNISDMAVSIATFINNDELRRQASQDSAQLAHPQAAQSIVDELEKLCGGDC
jgi:UDP-N-acetylglucosamine--N-acetylmuramyl-(pentapeptide) pyrophosphoryl-undecaprenol N-acetylglucosamine transferase